MEITFVTTELSPFVKVGGLADVSAALPKALRSLGHAATIVVPRFPELEAQGLLLARRLTPLRFTLGDRTFESTVFDGRLASQVDLVVVDVPGLFDRPGVYGERGEDYPDNAVRFAAFSRAVAELASPARRRRAAGRRRALQRLADGARADLPACPRGRDARARGDAHGTHGAQRGAPGHLRQGRLAVARARLGFVPGRRHRVLRQGQPAQAGHRDGRRGHDREPDVCA